MAGMDYNNWLKDLEAFLRSRRPDVKMSDLDPNATHQAFTAGQSPFVFGSQPTLPFRRVADPRQPVAPLVVQQPHVQQHLGQQTFIATIPCPKCGTNAVATAPFCQVCGSKLRYGQSNDGSVYGIIAIVSAGIGLFMCQVLVPFFILASVAFGAFAYHKGAKGFAIASFIMCAFLLAFFVYTMGQISSSLDDLRRVTPSR